MYFWNSILSSLPHATSTCFVIFILNIQEIREALLEMPVIEVNIVLALLDSGVSFRKFVCKPQFILQFEGFQLL